MTLIKELLDLQFPDSVKLSPNAQQVIYSTTLPEGHKKGQHAVSTFWLAETGKPQSSRQLTSGLYNDRMPRWSPSGKSIAFVSDRFKPGESSAIYLLPVHEGGEAVPLTPAENKRKIERIDWAPDGESIAFLSADEKTKEQIKKEEDKDDANVYGENWEFQRLRLLNVKTKVVTKLVSREAHVIDFAWNDDGTKVAFSETRTPKIDSPYAHGTTISSVDVSTKDIVQLCHFPKAATNITWAGPSLYFIGRGTENTFSACRVYTIDVKDPGAKSYEECAHGDDDGVEGLGKAGRDMVVHIELGLNDEIRMLRGKTLFSRRKKVDAWDTAFTVDSDEMVLAIAQGDTNSPPEVFTTTASGGSMVKLSNHGEKFSGRSFGTPHFLSCPSSSVTGEEPVRLDVIYVTPPSLSLTTEQIPSSPLPTVVLIHGGPYARITDEFNPTRLWSSVLLAAGYGVCFVNYRGGSGRGDEFAAFARGGCGLYDYADVVTITQHAIEQGFADSNRLIVGGWSQGGYLSYLASVRNGLHEYGWKFKGAIAGAGVSDWDSMILTSDLTPLEAALAGIEPWACDKEDVQNRKGSALFEFKDAVRRVGVIPPVLILHGEKDERVPIEQPVAFRKALESADLPYDCVTYPREGHAFQERKHIVDMVNRIGKFVATHIGDE